MAATNPAPVVITPEGLARALSIVGTLPSRFQLRDTVRARGVVGMVSGVCFREAKVFYEVGGIMHASDDVTEPLRAVSAPAYGPAKQNYPGGHIYRAGTSTGVTLPEQPDNKAKP